MIKDYFLNYARSQRNDFTVDLASGDASNVHGVHDESDWTVTSPTRATTR